MKWRYSLRIMRVRCILVETTVPVRIRPRMETVPVKGHFLSILPKVSNSSSAEVVSQFVYSHLVFVALLEFSAPNLLPSLSRCFSQFANPLDPPGSFNRLLRTYRCSCPQWQSWGYGNPDQHPCTIVVLPCPVWRSWSWSWSSRRCEAASGKHAPTGRSTRSPWHKCQYKIMFVEVSRSAVVQN